MKNDQTERSQSRKKVNIKISELYRFKRSVTDTKTKPSR